MKKTKQQKGITLIALIITIVVLLILAAVAISSITNDGILSYAQNAAKDYNQAVKDEQTMLQDYLDYLKVNDANSSALDGNGTEEEPYAISSIEDLILFAYDVNEGNSYQGKYVKLEKDLDFNLDASYENASRTNYSTYGYEGNLKTALTTGEGFIPIGLVTENDVISFAGVFDGNGKTISNLMINKESYSTELFGLFGRNDGVIKNLGVKNCNINISIENASVGGVCGLNSGEINGCWISGSINGTFRSGGIVGTSKEGIIKNCYNTANVNGTLNNSYNCSVGGILATTTSTVVENCYNLGNIVATQLGSGGAHAGGCVAYTESNIENCYNIGQVKSAKLTSNPHAGGVAGYATGVCSGVCNIGEVLYEGTSTKYVGTLIGAASGTLSNSYTLTNAELNGIGRNYSSTPEPTKVDTVEEMPTVLEIVGDAFKADTNNVNNGYPILSWQ